jgi:hypothetical protein
MQHRQPGRIDGVDRREFEDHGVQGRGPLLHAGSQRAALLTSAICKLHGGRECQKELSKALCVPKNKGQWCSLVTTEVVW